MEGRATTYSSEVLGLVVPSVLDNVLREVLDLITMSMVGVLSG